MAAVQFRLIDKRRIPENLSEMLLDKVDDVQKAFYTKLVSKIVGFSPVDTGTYMENHGIGQGRSSQVASASSNGKPRGQSREPYANSALSRLISQINSLPSNPKTVYVGNFAVHASLVEHGGANWSVAYSPYRRARAMSRILMGEAISEVGKI